MDPNPQPVADREKRNQTLASFLSKLLNKTKNPKLNEKIPASKPDNENAVINLLAT
jgi:hypothetical protein